MVLTMDVLANNYSNQGHDDNGTMEVHKTRCILFYMRSEFILSLLPFGLFQQECDCSWHVHILPRRNYLLCIFCSLKIKLHFRCRNVPYVKCNTTIMIKMYEYKRCSRLCLNE